MGGKLKAAAFLLVMYGLGIGSGITWQTYRFHHHPHKMMLGERRIARLKKQLHLNPWQEQSLQEIVQDARERASDVNQGLELDLTQIHEDSLDAIHQLLTSDQQREFEKIGRQPLVCPVILGTGRSRPLGPPIRGPTSSVLSEHGEPSTTELPRRRPKIRSH